MKEDILTNYIILYKKTKNQQIIIKVQRIITPIILNLLRKWKFNFFPKLIYLKLFQDAKTIILAKVLKQYIINKGSKFSSYYATTLNFYLRAYYMKYFQRGKPIKKRWGRLHELSLNFEYNNNQTLEGILRIRKDFREDLDNKLILEASKKLNYKDQKILKICFSNNNIKTIEIAYKYHVTTDIILQRKKVAISNLQKLLIIKE